MFKTFKKVCFQRQTEPTVEMTTFASFQCFSFQKLENEISYFQLLPYSQGSPKRVAPYFLFMPDALPDAIPKLFVYPPAIEPGISCECINN